MHNKLSLEVPMRRNIIFRVTKHDSQQSLCLQWIQFVCLHLPISVVLFPDILYIHVLPSNGTIDQ